MPAHSPINSCRQQKRLCHDTTNCRIEIRVQQPRQFQSRLIHNMCGFRRRPVGTRIVPLPAMPPERSPRQRHTQQIGSREAPAGRILGQGLLAPNGNRRIGGPFTTGHTPTVSPHKHDPAYVPRRVSSPLHKCSPGAAELEKVQRNLRTYTTALLPRHIRKPRQVQLVRHGDRGRRTVTVLTQNQVGLTAPRVITLESVRAVQQDDHVGVLFQ